MVEAGQGSGFAHPNGGKTGMRVRPEIHPFECSRTVLPVLIPSDATSDRSGLGA